MLDQRGTRRAPRHRIIGGIEVLIDGNPALLVDMSVESSKAVRFSAGVAWSSFELPKGTPRYRAGIEFFDADADAVSRFCDTNRSER